MGDWPLFHGPLHTRWFGIVTRMSIILSRRPQCVKACLFSLNDDALLAPAIEAIRSKTISRYFQDMTFATRAQPPERPRSMGRMNLNSNCCSGLELPNGRHVDLSF